GHSSQTAVDHPGTCRFRQDESAGTVARGLSGHGSARGLVDTGQRGLRSIAIRGGACGGGRAGRLQRHCRSLQWHSQCAFGGTYRSAGPASRVRLYTAGTQLVIVLDQYERANTEAIGDLLSGFLDHAVTTRLLIASRKRLNMPLADLRARDQVFEVGPSDLNLTPLETHALFSGVPELYTRRLQYETSGEAVALGFARRVMELSQRDFTSADDWQDQLYEYYRSEVLEALPAEMRESISRLVIVERFDLSLASALIGCNATDLIERLHRIDGI